MTIARVRCLRESLGTAVASPTADLRDADCRLSMRQHEMLPTLNTIFEELHSIRVRDSDVLGSSEFGFEPVDVSRIVRE
ncbi:MAG: hypothetical protein ACKV2Q_24635 [Planctomycetaceae bacterium]